MELDPIVTEKFGQPPDWVNLNDDPRPANVITSILMLVIATIAVILRFVARRIQSHPLMIDDYVLLVSLLFAVAIVALSLRMLTHGNGKHIWSLSAHDIVAVRRLTFCYIIVFISAVSMTKLSILLLYRRLFTMTDRWFRLCLYFAAFILAVMPFIVIIVMTNCCRPISAYWDVFAREDGENPVNNGMFTLAMIATNTVVDFYVLLLPIPQILKLQLTTQKKLGVVGLMLLGSFVCVIGVMHTYYLNQDDATGNDDTWSRGKIFLWSAMEPSVGILSACLPHLRPIWVVCRNWLGLGGGNHKGTGTRSGKGLTWERRGYGQFRNPSTDSRDNVSQHALTDETDKIRLTNVVIGGASNESIHGDGIVVRSEVRQSYTETTK